MVKKYLLYISTFAGRDIIFTCAVLLALGLMEGIGLMMIIPFLAIIGIHEQEITDNPITLQLARFAEATGVSLNLVSLLIIFVLLISLREYVVKLQTIQSNHLQQKIVNQFRRKLYTALIYSNWLFFTRERSSDMTHALTQDINRIGLLVLTSIRMISTTVIATVYLVSSLLVSFEMTLITILSAMLLLWAGRKKFKTAHYFGEIFTQYNNKMYALIGESLAGIKTAKCFSAESQQLKDFTNNLDELYQVQSDTSKSRANAKMIFGLGTAIILASFLLVAVKFLQLPAISILVLVFLFSRLSPKVSALQQDFLRLLNTLPALKSYDRLLLRANAHNEQQTNRDSLAAPKKFITLEKINFSYAEPAIQAQAQANTLTDINIEIPIGQSIAIIGSSGAGKSTITDILMGLVYPSSGAVCLDGHKLSQQQLIQWRKQIAYVPQDPHFLHDSIRNNLLWSKPDATEQALMAALTQANALNFVMALPLGLDTVIGDRGICLSGGECQRLAIARALLPDPTLLILDEATSALDDENQKNIMQQLTALKGKLTLVMITHRLSTLPDIDVIYEISDGKVLSPLK